jgi:hypothetical protein
MAIWQDSQLPLPAQNLNVAIASGKVEGRKSVFIAGDNPVVGTSYETIWAEGGLYAFPSSASTMTVSSDNANDTSAGTGVRTVLVSGLDSDYLEISETVTLNGTTAVTTVNSYLRINQLRGVTAGSTLSNVGSVYIGIGTVTAGKPATVYSLIEPTDGTSHVAVYTVPAQKKLYASLLMMSSDSAKNVTYAICRMPSTSDPVFYREATFLVIGNMVADASFLYVFQEKEDVVLQAKVSTGTSDTTISMLLIQTDEEQ